MADTNTPTTWAKAWVAATITWPFLVGAAFWLGRYLTKLEERAAKAEKQLDALTGRHMPALHRALGEVINTLAELRGLIVGRR